MNKVMRHVVISLKDFLARWTRLMSFSLQHYFPVGLKTYMHHYVWRDIIRTGKNEFMASFDKSIATDCRYWGILHISNA